MIRPKLLAYMCGSAARMSRNGASSMSVMRRRKSAGSKSSMGLIRWMPALLTRMSQSRLTRLEGLDVEQVDRPGGAADLVGEGCGRGLVHVRDHHFGPRAARARTLAAPIPPAPPVTRALRPFKLLSMSALLKFAVFNGPEEVRCTALSSFTEYCRTKWAIQWSNQHPLCAELQI